jgi:hypothetical protein
MMGVTAGMVGAAAGAGCALATLAAPSAMLIMISRNRPLPGAGVLGGCVNVSALLVSAVGNRL